jgi:hypothetical protein
MPVMVSAATMALMMASSVACTVAEKIVGQHFQINDAIGSGGAGIGRGEGDENVTGAVTGDAAVAAEAEGNAAREALERIMACFSPRKIARNAAIWCFSPRPFRVAPLAPSPISNPAFPRLR